MGEVRITRNAVKCLDCGDTIESTHRHHWVQCSCGHAFVDGGTEYLRRGFLDEDRIVDLSEVEGTETVEGKTDSKSEARRKKVQKGVPRRSGDAWTTTENLGSTDGA